MNANLLTILERAGGQGLLSASAERWEREALALHIAALKGLGHAIVVDEVYEHDAASGDIRVLHFLTCKKCAEGK